MSLKDLRTLVEMYAELIGVNSIGSVILSIAVVAGLLRLLPWERGRPVRPGFLLVAPAIAAVSLAAAFAGGLGAFYFIMFGIFEDKTVMPWLTLLPALAIGPSVGAAVGLGLAYNLGRVVRYL